ncbi:MAG: hypothetical protein JRF15_07625 [Deltaproteobacteria bacterium]|jgi:mRNA-degrading endonuclease RelE of RelBE toxin-antitoxin system|nr:hypothetical protein [Deltaproteobacteria bacterium]
MRELDSLLDYTIRHNEEHAKELESLARRARELGKERVDEEIERGVEQLNQANQSLKRALKQLRE